MPQECGLVTRLTLSSRRFALMFKSLGKQCHSLAQSVLTLNVLEQRTSYMTAFSKITSAPRTIYWASGATFVSPIKFRQSQNRDCMPQSKWAYSIHWLLCHPGSVAGTFFNHSPSQTQHKTHRTCLQHLAQANPIRTTVPTISPTPIQLNSLIYSPSSQGHMRCLRSGTHSRAAR